MFRSAENQRSSWLARTGQNPHSKQLVRVLGLMHSLKVLPKVVQPRPQLVLGFATCRETAVAFHRATLGRDPVHRFLMAIKVVRSAEAFLSEAASLITNEGLFMAQNMFPAQIVRLAPYA